MDADITANIVDKTEKNANGKEAKRVQQLARELKTVEQFVHGLVVGQKDRRSLACLSHGTE